MASKHVEALRKLSWQEPPSVDEGSAIINAAADALEIAEAQLRIARRALREFKHGKHRCGSEAASEAASVLAAMRRAAKGKR